MIKLNIKPLSVNEAYKGRKYKTDKCDSFKSKMNDILPCSIWLPPPPYEIHFIFGLSSKSSDGDNCVKIAQDCISTKYNFNDKLIKKWIIEVENVKKGEEYIKFQILTKYNLHDK